MILHERRPRPGPWQAQRAGLAHSWLVPLLAIEWAFDWIAFALSRWAFLEVLEYLGSFSILLGVIFYFSESGDRLKQKHYQAWQVINTAQGKGGSGGRIEALQELNLDGVPLVGVNAAGAFLQGIRLRGANLLRANLEAADLRDSNLEACDLEYASLRSANLRQGNLRGVNLRHADLGDSDLVNASLEAADLAGANLANADLRHVNLAGAQWRAIKSVERANIYGVLHAPEGFIAWALAHKAVSAAGDE